MWSTAKWRTAIPAVSGEEGASEGAFASPFRSLASVAVAALAALVAVLPALVALGFQPELTGVVAAALAGLAVAIGAVKLAAFAWVLAARLAAGLHIREGWASVD